MKTQDEELVNQLPTIELLWAGRDVASYNKFLKALKSLNQMDVTQQKTLLKNAGVTQKAFDGEEDEEPLDEHFMLDVQGSVGIVSITGSMTHEESRYNRYFGITSYGDIQNALASAVNNAQVSTILMDFDSPGGTVSGISEASDFIAMVDSKHKPVYAYTGSQMTSAAYWLGINGRDVSASRMAEIGSIGVIAVHTEFSELMKEIGITPTVLRAGKYKALGNPYEKLSDLAESEIQASLDEAYGFFTDHVASARGVSTQHVRESMAEGRVFRGERAKELGLIDNVESLNDVVTRLNEDNTPEQQGHHTPVYSDQPTILGNSMTTKRIVTEASQAAIASGASSDQVEDLMTTQTDGDATGDGTTSQAAAEGEGTTPVTEPAADANEGTEGEASGEETPAATVSEATQGFIAQITELTGQLVKATVRAEQAEASLASITEAVTGMEEICRNSCQWMDVAIGRPALDLSALGGAALVQQYHATRKTYVERFPVGGVLEETEEASDNIAAVDNALENKLLRLASTKK